MEQIYTTYSASLMAFSAMHKTDAIWYIDLMVHYWLPTAEQTDGSRRPYICEMK